MSLLKRAPITFDGSNTGGNRSTHGTRIEIQNLRGEWSEQTASQAFNDIVRLQPLVPARNFDAPVSGEQFRVEFWSDDAELSLSSGFEQRLQKLFEERAVLRVNGLVDDASGDLVLEVNEEPLSLNIFDAVLAGLRVHKNYFPNRQRVGASRVLACGPFSFSFFVFDFSATSPPEHRLDSSEKKLVRDHRIYLYRDGVRVLPYGDPHDDWLQLDVIRGTQGASRVLGNDQTVGFVHISHSDNQMLRDKTNREGLLDEGGTYADFVAVLQVIVAYVRSGPYARYVLGKQRVRETTHRQEYDIAQLLIDVRDDPAMPPSLQSSVSAIVSAYEAERKYLVVRAERTEDLAGVGLSVESASHDIIAAGGRALQLIQAITSYVADQMPRNKPLRRQLDDLTELLRFITSRLNDVQGLFVSTRQSKRRLDIGRIAERVGKMFRYVLEQSKIELSVREPFGPLVIRSSQAALLQALVNLVDNAIYWVTLNQNRAPEIVIQVDSQAQRVIVADNGPGVSASDAPFIFEPFYSAKGEAGKGLGLYIAQQIGVRSGFSVELDHELELLSGANLVLSFTQDPK
ncbi:ATP-binding protein [Candidatus Poriferisodalis sp.]|uniref:ATP-binding protein n=1 Tax=Candidatus Poriferisodalis sp. TaxID=3101277 RepID=UPI003B5B58DC